MNAMITDYCFSFCSRILHVIISDNFMRAHFSRKNADLYTAPVGQLNSSQFIVFIFLMIIFKFEKILIIFCYLPSYSDAFHFT